MTTPAVVSAYVLSQQRMFAAAVAGDAHEFAVNYVRSYIEYGWRRESILHSLNSRGGGPCGGGYHYAVVRGHFVIEQIQGTRCSVEFSLRELCAEADARIAGAPRQMCLWPT